MEIAELEESLRKGKLPGTRQPKKAQVKIAVRCNAAEEHEVSVRMDLNLGVLFQRTVLPVPTKNA